MPWSRRAGGKRWIAIPALLLCLLLPAVAKADYRAAIMADSPSGYWRLSETSGTSAADASGNANTGTYSGGVTLNQAGAIADANAAARFDGLNDGLTVPDSNTLDMPSAVTVEAWVKRTKSGATQVIAGKPGNSTHRNENYSLWLDNQNRVRAYFGNGSSSINLTGPALDTNWHLVAATYDNATARLYVDGTQRTSSTSTLRMAANTQPLTIGRESASASFLGATLDEVAVFNRALTAAQLLVHYNARLADTTAPVVTLTQPASGASTGATPVFAGAAGTAAGDSATVTVKIYSGTTPTGLPVRTLTTTRTGATWTLTPLVALLDGTYTARAEQADADGNTGLSGAPTFTVDTVAPVVTLSQPPDGSGTTNPRPTFNGTADGTSTVTVRVYAGTTATGTPEQTLTAQPAGGAWTVTPATALADGVHTARASQTDAAANTGQSSTSTFTVDATAPAVTLTQPPGGALATSTPHFGGAAGNASGDGALVTVDVYAGATVTGTPVQSLSAARTGATWGIDATALADGTYTARASQPDALGNTGRSADVTFTIDTVAPAVTLSQPADGAALAVRTPTYGGASDTGGTVTVSLYAGSSASGSPLQTLPATVSGGAWSVDGAVELPDGTYTARAAQSDAAGNAGQSSAATFTVFVPDTTAPAVTIDQPADGSHTADNTPPFSGTAGDAAGDDATVTLRVYAGTDTSGTPVDTQTVTRTGTAWTATASALADGVYTARAQQGDAAGNTGSSAAVTFTVDTTTPDTTPPVVTLTQPADGAVSGDPLPTFAGAAGTEATDSATVTVKLYSGTTPTGLPVRTLTTTRTVGAWSVPTLTPLLDGTYTARAEQADTAGNTGLSNTATFTVDTAAPAVTLTQPAGGSTSTTATPGLSGAAGAASGDSQTVTARLYAGSSATGTPVQTLAVTRGGASWSATPAALPNGTYTAQAEQADAAGNTGRSTASTFVVAVPPPSSTAYRDAVLSDGPRGYWRLGEAAGTAAADASSNANNGTYAGGVALGSPGAISGDANTAAQLDGLNDSVSVPDAASLDLTAGVTIEAWVKRSKAGWQVIAGKAGNGQSRLENYSMWLDSGNFLRGFFGNGTVYATVSSTAPIDTAWHHLVATYDNAAARLYIDGTLNASTASTVQMAANADPFIIGRDIGNTYFLGATVDDVAVYATALSANRIRSHYDAATATDTVGPAVTLSAPADGSMSNDGRPTFSGSAGTAAGDSATVTVKVYAGTSPTGTPAQTLTTTRSGAAWSVQAGSALAAGTYTARAEQADGAGNTGLSNSSTFAIDTTAPDIGLSQPSNGASIGQVRPAFSGEAGALAGDSQTVTVKVYAGTSATGSPLQTLTTTRNGPSWLTQASADLALGTYTARAEQADAAGNTGLSAPSTFTIVDQPPPPSTNYRDEVMADSPRAYWRLGEASGTTAADSSGNNNTGTYVGGVSLGQPGRILSDSNTSAAFDGVNDYMTVPDSASLDVSTGASVEAWMKRSKDSWQVVVGKPGNGQSRLENYAIWIDSGNFVRGFYGNGTAYATVIGSAAIDTNWHHIVTTYDNATAKLYVDGVLDASATSTVSLTPNASALAVGREVGNTFYFGGRLDDIAVYGTALSAARIAKHYAAGNGTDTSPPAVTLTTPEDGSTTIETKPTYAGQAAITGTDSNTVTVSVYAGTSATGTAVQTLSATKNATGSWTVDATAALPLGTYTAQSLQTDMAGNVGRSAPQTFTIGSRAAVGSDKELIGAGDIAFCDDTGDEATALLLDQFPTATVFTAGDNAYESGTISEFNNCYQPTWGRAKARTRPALGDHDYADHADPNATGYMNYFGAQLAAFGASAADPARGYYSYDLGAWHIVVLNPQCGDEAPTCSPAAQVSWLQADLAAHPAACTAAVAGSPRFSSGSIHGNNADIQQYWAPLVAAGADLYLAGDDHDYERFAPQDANGNYSANGLRQIVVGTGGRSHYPFAGGVVRANSEVRNDDTYGIMRLVLRPNRYEWEFVPQAGRTFIDSGSDACH